jgi:putative acetyltransferase
VNEIPFAEVIIRPEAERDHAEIADVVARAFGSTDEARLVDAIRASEDYIAELSLVAVVGDLDEPYRQSVVGHVMISRCRLVDTSRERSIVMLSPLAVDPNHHRRGIGSELVRAATGLAEEAGEPLVVLEGDPRYYSRFGFEHANGMGIELPLPHWAPIEAGQVLRLRAYEPDLRGRVVYPASFDVLGDDGTGSSDSR